MALLHNDGYLPPASIPDFSLPEVIDNRNVGTNETRNYPNGLYHPPDRDSLRALTRKGLQDMRYLGDTGLQAPQHHRRPTFPQGKHSRQTTTQSPLPPPPPSLPALGETPASLANRINVEEMSCQNTGDELFFR